MTVALMTSTVLMYSLLHRNSLIAACCHDDVLSVSRCCNFTKQSAVSATQEIMQTNIVSDVILVIDN